MRAKVSAALLALLVSGGLAACGSDNDSASGSASGSGSSSAKSDAKPLKIGLIPPTSGALAVFGTDEMKGWQVAADQANAQGGVDGHKVELIKASTDGQPASTIRAARKLATQQGAKFIGAIMTSPEAAALAKQLPALGALNFNSTGKDDGLIGADCSPDAFRSVTGSAMDVNAIAASMSKLPAKTWAIQAVDYSTGHSAAAAFKAAAEKAGKKIVLTQYAPLNTSDFGSYISKLKSAKADGLFAVEYGADGVAFVNQGAQFKLFDQYKTVLGFNMVSEPLFKTLGKKVTGFYNNVGYDVDADNALNQTFVADYKKANGTDPYYVPADTYMAAQILFAAVKKAGSVDPQKVKAAMKDLSVPDLSGQNITIGPDGQAMRPSHVGQVVAKAGGPGGLGFKIVSTTPASVTHPSVSPDCKM
ncbi:MAG TPA: ABC transporter substrate-binding protein [Baekduia sp.]|uniref:ABC transporter substrate-binding protein n=1 Tax=Baekduia sp. TaxID=2600305 RepID=UPI002D7675B9|nr:ABC transporter substrate-binding protein [Baekduia sp.]HET6507906.1 ABC transporter substrate-binding protein [Baekduia sp.]